MKAGIPDSINIPTTTITSTTTTTTAEEETLKRNTDCVYFLASPLTCKKGSECEYRHSEDARMNPRDCWYWINSNCLNPKCSFRHPTEICLAISIVGCPYTNRELCAWDETSYGQGPCRQTFCRMPLDGLLGTPSANSTRSSLPPSLTAAPTQLPMIHVPTSNLAKQQPNPGKQGTPCFYFQKGLCLKGDRCPFMHESTMFADNSVPQPPSARAATFVTEPQILKKALGGLQKCTQQQKIPQANITKPVEVQRPAKAPTQTEVAMLRNGLAVKKSLPQPSSLDDPHLRYRPATVTPVVSGNPVRTHRPRQANPLDIRIFQNGKEPDEFGEASPGFDVLVDDERRSNYFRKEDEFGRMTGHEGRQVKPVNEFDYSRSNDYNGPSKFDQEKYKDSRGYDLYGRNPDHYAREQRKPSSERILERPALPERRGLTRAESPNQVDRSDLRYRLAKQRKVIGGPRSATSPDRRGDFSRRDDRDRHVADQSYRSHSRREPSSLLPRESSISNRLQGRIMLPGRSSSDSDYIDSRPERETDRGRNLGRLSPGRVPSSSSQGRLQDRIKRTSEDFTTEGRNFRGPPIRRDELVNNTSNFAGPKRLAELKQPKVHHVSRREQRSTSEDSLSFEGPKPLNVILKRKRETTGSGDDPASGNEEEINHREKGEFLRSSSRIEAANHSRTADVEEEEEEGLITTEGDELADEVHPSEHKEGGIEMEEDTVITDKVEEDNELESFDQGYEESEYYEQVEGGEEFKAEEDDTNVVDAEEEEEFSDDEDGDDFAKRIGVMFS